MKDRIVIWGTDEKEQDILVAIRLLHHEDTIKIWTFPKEGLDKDFAEKLFENWEEGLEDKFPQPHQSISRGITEENLLPDNIKTKKSDVIRIAEQEWRVRVLSYRLYQHIKEQVQQLDIRAANLTMFSKDVWEEAKDVSRSIKENTLDRNIKREQTTELRNALDPVFDKLKKLQEGEHNKFLAASQANLEGLQAKIDAVIATLEKNNNGKKAFEDLKVIQQEVKGIELITKHHYALRSSFNKAFETVKEKRKASFSNKIGKRVEGLKSAIGKMEASIKRDKDSSVYQTSKLSRDKTTQLEYQLRSAKIKLIDDRVESKQVKLNDMYLTLKDLEKKAGKKPAAKTEGKKDKGSDKSNSEKEAKKKSETSKDNSSKDKKEEIAKTDGDKKETAESKADVKKDTAKAASASVAGTAKVAAPAKNEKEEIAEVMAELDAEVDGTVEPITDDKAEEKATEVKEVPEAKEEAKVEKVEEKAKQVVEAEQVEEKAAKEVEEVKEEKATEEKEEKAEKQSTVEEEKKSEEE